MRRWAGQRRALGWLVAAVSLSALGSCNLITGVSKLSVADRGDPDGGAGQGGEGATGQGASAGSGGGSSGGRVGFGGDGAGGMIPTQCDRTIECIHPDACLIGACEEGMCQFTLMQCELYRGDAPAALARIEGTWPEGEVDCGSGCETGACCPGDTDGGCGLCGIRTCKSDQTGFECTGQGTCSPGETCSTVDPTWASGETCDCNLTQAAECDENCMPGPCE